MKILILVLSQNAYPFSNFMRVQQTTWGNPDTVYYYGCGKGWNGNELSVNCTDDYEMMHWKFKLALDAVDYGEYDLVFRTNSCSYLLLDGLHKAAVELPLTNCYAGYQNGSYISGAGIFFSPDVLDLLSAELTDTPHGAEDVLIGQILTGRVPMINIATRIDAAVEGVQNYDGWHFRFKTSNDLGERMRDVNNMVRLHEELNR